MSELKLYRFIMTCLLVAAGIAAIKSYGDHRVNEFLSRSVHNLPTSSGSPLSPAGQPAYPGYTQPSSRPAVPLRQPPSADPWRVVETPGGGPPSVKPDIPLSVNPEPAKDQQALVSQALPQSQGLPRSAGSLAAPEETSEVVDIDPLEDATVAAVRQLRKRLGKVGVAEILNDGGGLADDFDAEAVFAETVKSLQSQAQQKAEEINTTEDQMPDAELNRGLAPEEIAQAHQQLQLFAEMLKPVQPQQAEACQRLAERFGRLVDSVPSQKR